MLTGKVKLNDGELDEIGGGTWKDCQVWSHKTIEAISLGEKKTVSPKRFSWLNF